MKIEQIGAATLINADCRVAMAVMDENSVDAIVCDPPYGLSFMGKGWDHGVPGKEFWVEALRVAKPGAYLLAAGGQRTHHRLMCGIENAGWEIRDVIMHVFGSGFPKSHNGPWGGTALKPAYEPWILCRKPLIGTVAANVQQYGTGGLNIDGCRVPTEENLNGGAYSEDRKSSDSEWVAHGGTIHSFAGKSFEQPQGRWPANLIHDGSDEVRACFPYSKSGALTAEQQVNGGFKGTVNCYGTAARGGTAEYEANEGSAARFFYCAKASKSDRDSGGVKNVHSTVKPTELMRYLCRLVTPPGGTVLDPFMGSGSTGKAALKEGFNFIGIELDEEHGYFDIACARVQSAVK